MDKIENIAVFGGGSWGTALACQIARVTKEVTLFLRDETIIDEIRKFSTNKKYLDNIILPKNIYPTCNLKDIIKSQLIIIAIPSSAFTETLNILKEANLNPNTILLIATKGISNDPVQLLSDKVKTIFSNPLAFIAGPNFAKEVAENLFTPITIAAEDTNWGEKISTSIESENFTVSITNDIVTVQIAGALKNIIAIKSGMNEAMGYKQNAKAGLITSGLKEIMKLSQALGGKLETLLEPAVLGDLMLTCYSKTSRNTKFGYEFIKSENPKKFLNDYPILIEGKESAKLVKELINKFNLDLPIISSVVHALEG